MPKPDYVFIQGKVKWCRPHVTNPWGDYTTVVYPNAAGIDLIRELQAEGIKNQMKKDEDGYFLTIKRPAEKVYNGKTKGFAPPEVLGEDGKTPLRDINIGNGSDVTLKIMVYSHKTPGGGLAKALRWEAIRVDNLVPFDGKQDFTEGEERATRGLEDQPEQIF